MCTQNVYTKCVHKMCIVYTKYSIDDTRILASVLRRNRSYCRAIQRTALEKSKTPHHDMSKAHFIDLAIVERTAFSSAIFPFFTPPLNRLGLLTVVSVSFQSLTNTSLRGCNVFFRKTPRIWGTIFSPPGRKQNFHFRKGGSK